MGPTRVLVVSHTYVEAWQRAKLELLGACEGIELAVLVPARWKSAFGRMDGGDRGRRSRVEPAGERTYTLIRGRELFPGRLRDYCFLPGTVPAVLRRVRPQVVYVEAEMDSRVLAQFVRWKRRYGYWLVAFGWENVARPGNRAQFSLPRWWLRKVRYRRERANLQRVDKVVWGNLEGAALVRAAGFAGPVHVLPQLGVDPAVYAPGDRRAARQVVGLPTEGVIIGFVGRLVPSKGLWTLCRALDEGLRAGRWRLLIVGGGPLERALRAWAGALCRPGAVHFAEAVPRGAVPEYLRALDVLVLPSESTPLWKEQFGHVLIEAMACGVPVVGSDSGAIPEVIGAAGLLFPEGDAVALRTRLEELLGDPQLSRALIARGHAQVAREYTHERIATQLCEILRGPL